VKDLRVVLALAETRTTAGAAGILHLTQSAVSRALGAAEARVGVPLFTRTSKGLVPTEAGKVLLDGAPQMLASLTALERRVRRPSPQTRRVRFAAECHQAYPWLTKVVLGLQRTAPHVELRLSSSLAGDAVRGLREGELDAALLTSRTPPGATSRRLFSDEIVFLLATDHPLAGSALRPSDLLEHPILASTARAGDRWFTKRVWGSRRVRPRMQRFAATEAIVEFARAGLGIGVLSSWIADGYLGPRSGLVTGRLAKGPLVRKWRLAHTPDTTPVIDDLEQALLSARPRP